MRQLGKTPGKPTPDAPVFEIAFETDDVAGRLRPRRRGRRQARAERSRRNPGGRPTSYISDPNGYLVEICSPVQSPSAG